MQKFFRLPEITVRILVRPTIGHLLYTLLFVWIERQDYSVHMSSVLQVQQLYTAGIPLLQWPFIGNNRTRKERLSQNKMAAGNVVQIHTHAYFPRSKKRPTYYVVVPTGKAALVSQRSIFRENRLKFRPSSVAEKVSIVWGTNNRVKCCVTDTHTNTQTKYCNPRCAIAPRVNNSGGKWR